MGLRTIRRSAVIRLRVWSERSRAQRLRLRFEGVEVDRHARLARGANVDVAPGAHLRVGPCAIGADCVIEVASAAHVELLGDFIGARTTVVARKRITIGAGTLVAEMCVIRDSDHLRDEAGHLHATAHASAAVTIEAHCWLGARSTVLKGVTLGEGATVAAGAVVTRDVPAATVVGGVPARIISSGPD